jgi:Protein of unknown function (DUF4013)
MDITRTLEEILDAEKSFSYPFEDKDWVSKLGLGALMRMVPILNFAWSGYLVDIIRNVMHNAAEPLPTWDDLGKKFNEGLILFAASLIYAAPVLIAVCLPLTIIISSSVFSENSNTQDIGETMLQAGGILLSCVLCVLLLYGLVLSIIYPAILVLFAREGTFASCFKLREALDMIRKNVAPFLTAWALSLAASLGVGLIVGFVNLVVSWIPCAGWIVGMVLAMGAGAYGTAVYAHLFGQVGRTAFENNQAIIVP